MTTWTDPGSVLLAAAAAAGAVSVLAGLARGAPAARVAHYAFLVALAAFAGATLRMLAAFLDADVMLQYVWDHTHTSYAWPYRTAGLWAGSTGTLLVWGSALAACLALEKRRLTRALRVPVDAGAGARNAAQHRVVHVLLLGLVTAFAVFLLVVDAFAATPASTLRVPGGFQGRGLQPILLHPLMVIHPPIQFVAYGLMALVGALGLGALAAGSTGRAWAGPALQWARWAWLWATLGLGLGALWAYYVLSFGGFWAWDPVETGNLLPWLALTAFLHAGKHAQKFDAYRFTAPLLAFAAFWLTLFATFVTRSGLWVSVHAFTDPTNRFDPDWAARLLSILDVHAPTRFFTGLLLATLLAAAALAVAHEARAIPAARWPRAVARGYAVVAAALAGVALAAPATLLGAAFEVGRALPGGVHVGTGALALAVLALPPFALYLARPEPEPVAEPERRLGLAERDWVRPLMYAAVVLLTIGLVVAFLLNAQVVNGFHRGVFDARAPLVVTPLLVALTLMLAHPVIGKPRAVALAGGGLALGLAGYAAARAGVLPVAPVVALATPVTVSAAAASALRVAHVNRGATGRVRVAGLLLLTAGLLGAAQWASPPSTVTLGDGTWAPGVPAAMALFALGALGIVGAVAALRASAWPLAVAGAVAATLAAGYGVGAALGLAALVLIVRARAAFRGRAFLPGGTVALRQTGIYLVHFALAVGLTGYAASTYAVTEDQFVLLDVGESTSFADAGTVILGPAGGSPEHVVVPFTLERDGRTVTGEIAFEYAQPVGRSGHYAQDLRVERGIGEDVYAAGFGLAFADGSTLPTLEPTRPREPADVTAVTFELKTFPLMGLVWSGFWLMLLASALILTASVMERARARRGNEK